MAEMKAGYKKTDIGIIPEDWDALPLDNIARVRGGKRLPKGKALTDVANSHPYIRVLDMKNGSVDVSEIRYVPDDVFPEIKNYRIYASDLFISVAGTLGIIGRVPNVLDGANLTENANRICDLKIKKEFLFYYLCSDKIQNHIQSMQTVGAQPKLALGRIEKFIIPTPPQENEQKAIASALSDVDGLIESLEKLIAKKRDMKTAAMQQLLTGKKRLPGFKTSVMRSTDVGEIPEDWDIKQLGSIGGFAKGSGIKKDEAQSGTLPCVRYGELYTKHHDVIRRFYSFISEEVSKNSKKLKYGDILFACSGETKEEIGKCASFLDKGQAYAGGDIIILSPHSDNAEFLGYLLNSDKISQQKSSLGQGDAVVHINAKSLASIPIPLPKPEEQKQIAAALSDVDGLIESLEKRLAKARSIKTGMMQELLTGKTRLIKPDKKQEAS